MRDIIYIRTSRRSISIRVVGTGQTHADTPDVAVTPDRRIVAVGGVVPDAIRAPRLAADGVRWERIVDSSGLLVAESDLTAPVLGYMLALAVREQGRLSLGDIVRLVLQAWFPPLRTVFILHATEAGADALSEARVTALRRLFRGPWLRAGRVYIWAGRALEDQEILTGRSPGPWWIGPAWR